MPPRSPKPDVAPPPGATTSTLRYVVPFFDTDAMRIVHHANYVRYLELARVRFLEEHDAPYASYMADGLHFAVTRCEVRYRAAARFGDELHVTCWLERIGGASLAIAYSITCGGTPIASARTEHGMVDEIGRPARIPAERRRALAKLVAHGDA